MKPLAGLTVIDFSRVLAGPMATQILAELGASVIKVERPGTGDESRSFEPFLPRGESAYFMAFNRGKQSITIDLKSEAGRRLAADLASSVDVVVENFLPGEMARWGLDYTGLAERNPGLIYVSCTGFGQWGPYSDRNGYDTVFQALSGIMHLTGYADAPPAKTGVPVADMTSGLWIVISILAALHGRSASGRGAHVDLAMMDVQASLLALSAMRLFASGEDPMRGGTEHPGRVPSAAFLCRCGKWLHVSASDQHWLPLCRALGLQDLAADGELKDNSGRVMQRDRVNAALRAAVAQRDRAELAPALRAVGVPAGEVQTVAENLADPHMQARGVVGSFVHPTEGTFPALRTPLRFEGFDDPQPGIPPLLGADAAAILSHHLGLSDARIAQLQKEGAFR